MQNDIAKGACPAELVRCVVFDEAHKALGNYSYCQVMSSGANSRLTLCVCVCVCVPGGERIDQPRSNF